MLDVSHSIYNLEYNHIQTENKSIFQKLGHGVCEFQMPFKIRTTLLIGRQVLTIQKLDMSVIQILTVFCFPRTNSFLCLINNVHLGTLPPKHKTCYEQGSWLWDMTVLIIISFKKVPNLIKTIQSSFPPSPNFLQSYWKIWWVEQYWFISSMQWLYIVNFYQNFNQKSEYAQIIKF